MGWVKERHGKDGKIQYMAVYRDLEGRERSAGTWSTEKRAIKEWHDAEKAMSSGRVGDPTRGRQRFEHYVMSEWFPHHVIEETTRQSYSYLLEKYIVPELGTKRMIEILPGHIREFVLRLGTVHDAQPATIQKCKVVLDAIFTTALNDQITFLHAGRGVRTPPVPTKPRQIISTGQFDLILKALPSDEMRLLVEVDIESGLRWGELSELRVKDLDFGSGVLTVARAVVYLAGKYQLEGPRFVVKEYPKDRQWRQLKLAPYIVARIKDDVALRSLGPEDLLFQMPTPGTSRRRRPAVLPDPATLGLTEPNERGKQYQHGTLTAYQSGKCRCRFCKDVIAAYRAERRTDGKDHPREARSVTTDGHISGDWFRKTVWYKALKKAGVDVHVTPHGLRHAHASWLLAGGADLQTVKDRLGHGSISTTERYLHGLPNADDTALAALDSIRRPRVAPLVDAATVPAANEGEVSVARDVELGELRSMVAKLTQLVGALGPTGSGS